jgi:transcriptional regulator with XRE-family HTH domain
MRERVQAVFKALEFQTQAEMARHYGVSQGMVSKWLSGADEPKGKHRDLINDDYDRVVRQRSDEMDESFAEISRLLLRLPPPLRQIILAGWKASLIEMIAMVRRPPKR